MLAIKEQIEQNIDEFITIRHYIHAHPEVAFEEQNTANYIASYLQKWGIPFVQGIGGTGIVATLTKGGARVSIGLRADIDALPILEENQLDYASTCPGKMHACGHDGHTTMLLAAAWYLAHHAQFNGTIHFIFQPAEEIGGGAQKMLQDDLLSRFPMQMILGMHNMPEMPAGTIALSSGPVLASSSEFKLTIHGKGGHAAMPHKTIDPILIATQLVQAWQGIISRNKAPQEVAALSVCYIHAGETFNVIPETCILGGTLRTYSDSMTDFIKQRMEGLAQSICLGHQAQCDFQFQGMYPSTINDENVVNFVLNHFENKLNKQIVKQEPIMASEDFSFFLQNIPGCYCFIGNGEHEKNGQNDSKLLHGVHYNFNDQIISTGGSYFTELALAWLKHQG